MTTKTAGKPSFRIDDILDKPKEDTNNNSAKKVEDILKIGESSVFRPYAKLSHETKARLDFEKSLGESFYRSPRDSIYNCVDKYGVTNRSVMVGYQSGYGYGGLQFPYDNACGAYSSGIDNRTPWNVIPGLINNYGYHHFPYSPYLRPLPVSLAKRKGGQVRFTPQQTQNLERRFGAHKYLSPEDRRILAGQLKLSDRQVKTWFQNRRAKWRRANNINSNEGEDIESDNQSEEDCVKDRNEYRSNSPISV